MGAEQLHPARWGSSFGYNLFIMSQTLLETDEETDVGAYGAYLRAQSDPDLLDIAQHLDPERYPARQDAAWREVRRRHLLPTAVYTFQEYLIRRLCVFALLLAGVTLALTVFLTPTDADGPAWPDLDSVPDGTPASVLMRLFSLAVLRAMVYWSAWLGLYVFALGGLLFWLVSRAALVRRHQARADVWRFVLVSFALLAASITIALLPFSAVPGIFASHPNAAPGTYSKHSSDY